MTYFAGTAEVVPIKKRGKYVGLVVLTILPFCPSVLYAQLIAKSSNWRYNGIFVGVWYVLLGVACLRVNMLTWKLFQELCWIIALHFLLPGSIALDG